MNATLQKYATPLTTGLFLISLISGVALFFHLGSNYFRGMHEWLSMVLAVPFALHIWKNWRAFITYFKRPPMMIALAASLAGALAFAIPAMTSTESRGGNPMFALAQAIEASSVSEAAPIFGHTSETLTASLTEAGYKVASADQTLTEVAAASGKTGRDIVAAVVSLKK